MSVISFKEISMLLMGLVLIYSLYYLKTEDELFTQASIENVVETPIDDASIALIDNEPKTLPLAVLEQVQIPNWLSNKDDFEVSNLTLDDLLELAKLSHEQDHDFFPDNQNTLVYLLKAKELGIESAEVDELLTKVHATLYDQADQAGRDYDAATLTALTARLKSIDPEDPRIQPYTDQISMIYTLERLQQEITTHIRNNNLYETDQKDAVHTLIVAKKMDPNYQPVLELEEQILTIISELALRAAQELDFTIADQQVSRMNEIDSTHGITLQTITEIQDQKQNRFAYLDQQFYSAINNLNLARAQNMIEALADLEIATSQLSGYQSLFEQTKTYGPYKVADEFNDILSSGGTGPNMVVMPKGEYFMGSQSGPKHQRPSHLVTIDYGYAVSQTEINVEDFQKFILATQYKTTAEKNNRAKIYDEGTGRFKDKFNVNWRHDYLGKNADSTLPVIHVSWDDAKAYTNWLKEATGHNYRLLSESEFEFVLSAGSDSMYPWGNDEPSQIWGNFSGGKDKLKRSRIKWREGFSEYTDGYWGPAPVGSFIKSMYGLHDLSGNVMEWVEDCWHDSYTRAPGDGTAWVNRGCNNRVIRGGNWGSANEEYRIHHRVSAAADLTDPRIGFRVARSFEF
ncbi:MAG: SUMF1/EgtB/PvdO family nonheme iron enzyme [Marinicella sp.]